MPYVVIGRVNIALCLQILQAEATVKLPTLVGDQTGISGSSLFSFSPNPVIVVLA